jgi:5-methyltetrahydropteroyltriglutamate--homocysteine methyltransferase
MTTASYVFQRLGGLELAEVNRWEVPMAPPKSGGIALGSFASRRDWQLFSDAYADPSSGASLPDTGQRRRSPVCRGPITYRGQDAVQRDIANLKAPSTRNWWPTGSSGSPTRWDARM